MSPNKVKNSLNRAIDFLYRSQLPWGEFRTLSSWNFLMISSRYDSSPFSTGLILHSLKGIEDKRVKEMTKKAIDFLLSEKEDGGIWRFWTSKNKKTIPPDLDDISVISSALKLYGVQFKDNTSIVLNNRNKDGLFRTWVLEEKDKNNFFWRAIKNDVDCVVNANVLIYLKKTLPEVCGYIGRLITSGRSCSYYYPNRLVFFYLVSRAIKHGVLCTEGNKERIVQSVLSYRRKNSSFGNEMETGLALNTLLNLGYSGKEIEGGIGYLISRQEESGGFKKCVAFLGVPWWFLALSPFYGYYGSEELTTGFCVEALKNYLYL